MAWINRVLWLEPLYVVALGIPILLPGRFVSLRLHYWLLLFVLLFCFARWLLPRHYFSDDYSIFLWPTLLLTLSIWVGIAVSPETWISIAGGGYLIHSVAIHMAAYHWPPFQNRPILFALMLVGGMALFSFVAPLLVLWKPEFRLFSLPLYQFLGEGGLSKYNFTGENIHANILAGLLVPLFLLLLPFCIGTASQLLSRRGSTSSMVQLVILWGLAAYWLLLIGLTQSRGAYLGLLVGVGVMIVSYQPRMISLIAGTGTLGFIALGVVGLIDPTLFLGMESALGGGEFRWDIWSTAAYAISDAPLTGIGIGMYSTVVPALYPFVYVNGHLADHAHNLLLQIGLDVGIPGLISFLAILALAFMMLWSLIRKRSTGPHGWLGIGAASALCGLLTHGLLDAVVWGTKISSLPWILLTLIMLLYRQEILVGSKLPTVAVDAEV